MVKNRLLAASIVVLEMFSSVEGMNGLPKLNLAPRNTNSVKNIEFKNVTFDEDSFKHLLETKGNELVGKDIIKLADKDGGYTKKNIKKIDLQKFEEVYDVKITKFENRCFNHYESLEKIVIPGRVDYAGLECFEGCFSLKEIEFSDRIRRKLFPFSFFFQV